MKQIEVDDNTVWEDTGKVVVHNYPASSRTYSYITRVYREYKRTDFGYKEVEGEPIYFHDIKKELVTFAIIIAESQSALSSLLPIENVGKTG